MEIIIKGRWHVGLSHLVGWGQLCLLSNQNGGCFFHHQTFWKESADTSDFKHGDRHQGKVESKTTTFNRDSARYGQSRSSNISWRSGVMKWILIQIDAFCWVFWIKFKQQNSRHAWAFVPLYLIISLGLLLTLTVVYLVRTLVVFNSPFRNRVRLTWYGKVRDQLSVGGIYKMFKASKGSQTI